MQAYLARRILLFLPTLIVASLAVFIMMRVVPGDVAEVILAGSGEGSLTWQKGQLESLREELGLNDPLPVQYGKWAWSLVNGEFGGRSLVDKTPLSHMLAQRAPVTLLLTVYATLAAIVVSIPLGIVAAIYQDRWPDYLVRVVTIAGQALPHFWLALVVILLLAVFFLWTPPLYYKPPWSDLGEHVQKMVWPALVLAWGFSSGLTRVTRSSMLEVLRQDYVRTARSKGLREQAVLWRHALKNALIPVITLAGLQFAALLGGTVILEAIFGLPGLGEAIIRAAERRDYPVVQTLAMVLVVVMLGINLLLDLVYVVIDPRISYS